ncbi:MAG: SCP2 sterol-binding domain-containing protein [Deltaproteobacteria bacterium]|nr:SCP2 sterol-binding domain-containing protein [Deltaproteobacteria bacterium]
MTSAEYFEQKAPGLVEKKRDEAAEVAATFQFDITGDGGGKWIVDLKNDPPGVKAGEEECDCNIDISNEDFVALVEAESKMTVVMELFSTGRMKVSNPMLGMKITKVLFT